MSVLEDIINDNEDVAIVAKPPIKSFGEHMAKLDVEPSNETEDKLKHKFAEILQELYEHNQFVEEDFEENLLKKTAIAQTIMAMDAAIRFVTHKSRWD